MGKKKKAKHREHTTAHCQTATQGIPNRPPPFPSHPSSKMRGWGCKKTSTGHFNSGPNSSSMPHSLRKEKAGVLGGLRSAEYADGLSHPPIVNGFVRFARGSAGGPALGFSSPQSCKVGGERVGG